jgi:CxxC motif-containing protein (DUF1111 family)
VGEHRLKQTGKGAAACAIAAALFLALPLLLAAPAALGGGAAADRLEVAIGRALFERAWVPAPSSTRANDGLGPLFNARACVACHGGLERHAVAAPEGEGRVAASVLLRLSDAEGRPDPAYGRQLQTAAVPGFTPEGRLLLAEDGKTVIAADLAAGAFAATTRLGLRVAPGLRGLGLLAAVPAEAIRAGADPTDADGDGVTGRPHALPDGSIGRFGWKASSATLADQVAIAFSLDLGMGTAERPAPAGDCTPTEPACLTGPHGGTAVEPEIAPEIVTMLAQYLVAVPPAKPAGPAAGAGLFAETGCAACHSPALATADGRPVPAFTDLLLHDMGPGLDGGATEPGVAPTEWRTAPLWGLSGALAAGAGLLHDGRAADVAAAIGWHGGEAAGSRDRFSALSPQDRARLLDYVSGL